MLPIDATHLSLLDEALMTFGYIDHHPEAAEASWREVAREQHLYVIGHHDGPSYKAWEMLYTDLLDHGDALLVVQRHSSAAHQEMVPVEVRHNIGVSVAGHNCHRLRLWQRK